MSSQAPEFIGGTRRADGTLRKVRMVKPGYTPPDESDKFETAATKFNNFASSTGKAGLERATAPDTKNQFAGKTKNQIKNEKRKMANARKAEEERQTKLDNALNNDDTDGYYYKADEKKGSTTSTKQEPQTPVDAEKRIKNLKKKLKAIAQLQAKLDIGELSLDKLEAEQKEKLENKAGIDAEITSLETKLGGVTF